LNSLYPSRNEAPFDSISFFLPSVLRCPRPRPGNRKPVARAQGLFPLPVTPARRRASGIARVRANRLRSLRRGDEKLPPLHSLDELFFCRPSRPFASRSRTLECRGERLPFHGLAFVRSRERSSLLLLGGYLRSLRPSLLRPPISTRLIFISCPRLVKPKGCRIPLKRFTRLCILVRYFIEVLL
jgi:hypothetical protein